MARDPFSGYDNWLSRDPRDEAPPPREKCTVCKGAGWVLDPKLDEDAECSRCESSGEEPCDHPSEWCKHVPYATVCLVCNEIVAEADFDKEDV